MMVFSEDYHYISSLKFQNKPSVNWRFRKATCLGYFHSMYVSKDKDLEDLTEMFHKR